MKTAKFQLEPLTCPSCIKKIEGKLNKMDGVKEAKVLFNSSKVKVTFDTEVATPEALQETIENLGYPVLSNKVA
ncbi:heavy-metal-associated domain-containing protein [Oceanobacillus halotolerans]|uniref:heavy-metal-associated domain-containing protein n=1 Tax=Oceanobacillus halotolerans TaxID=2663380 RepID=UPI0013D94ACD|nr:heavy-metal-associated domain-containing protein [Oceanobacillus halotolerans]